MKRFLILIVFCTLCQTGYSLSVSVPVFEDDPTGDDSAMVLSYYQQAQKLMSHYPDKALTILSEAEIISLRSHKKYIIGDIKAQKGNAYRSMKDNASALRYYHAAGLWYKRGLDSVSLAGIYVNISGVCRESGDTLGCEQYLKLAERVCPDNSSKALGVKSLIELNSGVLEFKHGRYSRALKYFSQCLEINRKLKQQNGGHANNDFVMAYNNLAMTYMDFGYHEMASVYIDSALAESLTNRDSYVLAIVYSTKADLQFKLGHYAEAIRFYELTLTEGKKFNIVGDVSTQVYKDIYNCYYRLNDSKNALKYYQIYITNKDSLYSIEKLKEINEVESKYKLQQKNVTIAYLARQNILKEQLSNRQSIIIAVSVSILILLVVLIFLITRYTAKIRRLNNMLRHKSRRIIEQNKCIEAQKALLQQEANKLENENTMAHFEILKNQVNPHMLFNALGVLKGIIDKDKNEAKEFVDDLSHVFRQALQLKSDLLVTLAEELVFVEAYLHIITKRYENCFRIEVDVPETIRSYYIPPFSLQMIVENVIKHNDLDEMRPLEIRIFYKDEEIHITNTIARKKKMEAVPMGIGHQNLINRYKLVSEREPLFVSDEAFFSVRLPLFIDE